MDSRYIPVGSSLRPQFQLWPPQRHRATLWILAHLYLTYATAATPIAGGLHRLYAPSKMEVIPGGQPDTTGGKLSIDTLDSTPPPRREPQGTVMATQDEVRNGERVTPPQRIWKETVQSVGKG
jgi:hypothetical protein